MPYFTFLRDTTHSVSRGLAAFLGGFTLLNLLGETVARHFAGNFWWIDLRPLPAMAAQVLLLVSAIFMLAFAFRPAASFWRRLCTTGAAALLGLFAAWNAIGFFAMLSRGQIHSGFPLPLSLIVLPALAMILRNALRPATAPNGEPMLRRAVIAGVVLSCCIGFPLAQMVCFGQTDYRRPADAIVVFGARAYADGSASQALSDRVQTACDLFHQGLADKIIFSGGPGDGSVHETQAMRRLALQAGVPDSAIYCDTQGLNTDATVRNTIRFFRQSGVRRVLAVSHAYHLPRVKMAYRQQGWDVYTVPAHETRTLSRMPFLIAREVAALWAYYFRPFGGTATR